MDYLKKFGLRFLRLLWLIFTIIFAIGIAVSLINKRTSLLEIVGGSLAGILFISFILLGIQYLLFGSFKLSYLLGQNTAKIVRIILVCIFVICIGSLGVRYWNNYQYNQKLIAGSDPEIFDSLITSIAFDKGADYCYDDLPSVSKETVKQIVKDLDKQNIQGLNKLKILAQRDDQIGINVRCGIYTNKLNSKKLAKMFDIKY